MTRMCVRALLEMKSLKTTLFLLKHKGFNYIAFNENALKWLNGRLTWHYGDIFHFSHSKITHCIEWKWLTRQKKIQCFSLTQLREQFFSLILWYFSTLNGHSYNHIYFVWMPTHSVLIFAFFCFILLWLGRIYHVKIFVFETEYYWGQLVNMHTKDSEKTPKNSTKWKCEFICLFLSPFFDCS